VLITDEKCTIETPRLTIRSRLCIFNCGDKIACKFIKNEFEKCVEFFVPNNQYVVMKTCDVIKLNISNYFTTE